MIKIRKMPKCAIGQNVTVSSAPLVIQEGPKVPLEFIKLKNEHIPNAVSKKFDRFYKEKRVYKPRPVYSEWADFPQELQKVFELAIVIFEDQQPDWITLKRFLNDKTNPKARWLWGFSLRHRGTEKIKINQNDFLVILEWNERTNKKTLVPVEKLFKEDTAYIDKLEGIIKSSKIYPNGKSMEWLKTLYLEEQQKEKNEDRKAKTNDT